MIIDTSAMVAILYREPEAEAFARCIHAAEVCRISVTIYVELAMAIENQLGPEGMRQAEAFRRAAITIEPVTLISAIAFPIPSRGPPANRSCSRVMISHRPT